MWGAAARVRLWGPAVLGLGCAWRQASTCSSSCASTWTGSMQALHDAGCSQRTVAAIAQQRQAGSSSSVTSSAPRGALPPGPAPAAATARCLTFLRMLLESESSGKGTFWAEAKALLSSTLSPDTPNTTAPAS